MIRSLQERRRPKVPALGGTVITACLDARTKGWHAMAGCICSGWMGCWVFERFLAAYPPGPGVPWQPWENRVLQATVYPEIARAVTGLPLGGGLLRVRDVETGPMGQSAMADAFPEFVSFAVPFAHDWLGRQFAVDLNRDGQIMLLEAGSGETFQVDADMANFVDRELVEDSETYLELEFYRSWRASGGKNPEKHECVGFKHPLFLGGEGEVANLEISDFSVYWNLFGQMHRAIHGLA